MQPGLKKLLLPAGRAIQIYWPAIVIIQGLALAVVCSYYWIEGSADLLDQVARYKTEGGLLFAAVTTVISGGVLPELLKRRFRPPGASNPGSLELLHQFTMWAILGILVDRFYWLQAWLFGAGNDPGTLLIKVFFDQFIFTPFVALPFIVTWFFLYENRSQLGRAFRILTFAKLRARILPLWATSLCFWPLMLIIVYSLPSELQFPLFLFGNAAFSTLMIFIARRQGEEHTA